MSREYIFNVRQLTRYLRTLLAQDAALQDVSVRGEIADLVAHGSGHVYFTLKDEYSQLRCVMFRQEAEALTFTPEHGATVVARGTVTIYEPRGQYQLLVRELAKAGVGDLYLAFERLRRKLAEEGLFDEARKRPLPAFPRKIALLTSPDGAAVHDVVTTLRARWPSVSLLLIPTPVSGPGAAAGIVQSLRQLGAVEGLEVAILARGGGALEELAGFNAEAVARAIAAAPVPVVTGIGHETDSTIADFVADRRAATPTAAAVATVPDRRELIRRIRGYRGRSAEYLRRVTAAGRRELALLRARPVLSRPAVVLGERRQRVDETVALLRQGFVGNLRDVKQRLLRAREGLAALSPGAVLARGYSMTRLPDGSLVRSARQLAVGATAEVVFAEGSAEVGVRKTTLPSEENG